uniref:Uncharacterized protein n=1 Tax=Oryza glumipatula TaxID=40148 RepID=A0A0E0AW84_9ORYZ
MSIQHRFFASRVLRWWLAQPVFLSDAQADPTPSIEIAETAPPPARLFVQSCRCELEPCTRTMES